MLITNEIKGIFIESPNGLTHETTVETSEGYKLPYVQKVEFSIEVNSLSKAQISVLMPSLDCFVDGKNVTYNLYHKNGLINRLIAAFRILVGKTTI